MSNVDSRMDRPNIVNKTDGPNWTTKWNVGVVAGQFPGVPFNSSDQSAAPASVTDAPVDATNHLVIDDLIVSVGTTMTVTFKEETTSTVVAGPYNILANTTVALITPNSKGKKLLTAGKKLQVITSVSGKITVDVGYHEEP